jgi:hypothetical protein
MGAMVFADARRYSSIVSSVRPQLPEVHMKARDPELSAIYPAKKCRYLLKLGSPGRFEAVPETIRTFLEVLVSGRDAVMGETQ